jgi:hypothetical protein
MSTKGLLAFLLYMIAMLLFEINCFASGEIIEGIAFLLVLIGIALMAGDLDEKFKELDND